MIFALVKIAYCQKYLIKDINDVGTVWLASMVKIGQNIAVCVITTNRRIENG